MIQMAKFLTIMLVFCQVLAESKCYAEEPLDFAFITPREKGELFWNVTESFIRAVAEDLNVNLSVYYPNGFSSFSINQIANKILTSDKKPQYLITNFRLSTTNYLLNLAESTKVGFFSINTGVPHELKKNVGLPREKFKYWLGEMSPDDQTVGYDLAKYLIAQAKKQNLFDENGQISLLALSGNKATTAAFDRNRGLRQAVQEDPQVKLKQLVYTNWKRQKSYQKATVLLKRYPETTVIWAASDGIAMGAAQAIEEAGRAENNVVVTGGIDWTPVGLEAVKSGKIETTFGGHFMEAGWALLLLYDYHHGKDFSNDVGLEIRSKMFAITPENIQTYLDKFGTMDWGKINFKRFSKIHNPNLIKYDFSVEKVLSQE